MDSLPRSVGDSYLISAFVAAYGYWAVLLGTLLEGETVLLTAGYACQRGLLDWRLVYAMAVLGATGGDLCAFLVGRWRGQALIARFPSLARPLPKIQSLLDRFHAPLILAVRFLYGMRIAGPLLFGMGSLSLPRFAFLNFIGALLWAGVILALGYFLGMAVASLLSEFKHIEEYVLIFLLVLGVAWGLWRARRARRF